MELPRDLVLLFFLLLQTIYRGLYYNTLMYANDTVLFMLTILFSFLGKIRLEVIEFTLSSQLAIVNDLLQDNFLFLNIKKTEVVLFGTSGNLVKVDNFTITIGVIDYKYIGIL